MPTQKTTLLYTFDELSEEAQEKARDWFREATMMDFDDVHGESVCDDAKECLALLGIEVESVYYSGFHSQGDGACFEGYYSYRKGWKKALRSEIGGDDADELTRIGNELQEIQSKAFYKLSASVVQSGRYMHEGCTTIDVDHDDRMPSDEEYEAIKDSLREAMQWIYSNLRNEYEFQNSDEQVEENIRANDYTFDEDGNRED